MLTLDDTCSRESTPKLADTGSTPTGPGYCANCGATPCMTPEFLDKYAKQGLLIEPTAGTCAMVVYPVTLATEVNRVLLGPDMQKLFPGLTPREIVTELVRVCRPHETG